MSTSRLIIEHDGPVLSITLNRPDVHNAFDELLIEELLTAVMDFSFDDSARVLILSGSGKSFCAGADLDWMRRMSNYSREENIEDAFKLRTMLSGIHRTPKPIIAKVHGAAMGGGAGLVAAAHIAIASPSATFAFSEVKLGLVPAVISPYVIRKIGPANAEALFVTGERFDAERALRIGLIHEVAEDLDAAVDAKVKHILAAGPKAVAKSLELVHQVEVTSERDAADYTVQTIADLRASDEGREGISAFLEKRKPNWVVDQDSK